jgi:hypothetical protein
MGMMTGLRRQHSMSADHVYFDQVLDLARVSPRYRVVRLVIAERRADLSDCWPTPGLMVIDIDRGPGDLSGSIGGGKGTAELGESQVGLAARSPGLGGFDLIVLGSGQR